MVESVFDQAGIIQHVRLRVHGTDGYVEILS
jgi:hypothetical protein